MTDNLTSEQSQAIAECLRIAARRGRELRLQRERAIAERGDLETGQRGPLPAHLTVQTIQLDENTRYLGGPEITVWVQTAEGNAYIVAARNPREMQIAERVIDEVIETGIVPYGFPLNQKRNLCDVQREGDAPLYLASTHNDATAQGRPGRCIADSGWIDQSSDG